MADYLTSPLWADLTPLPVDEGTTPQPLASIAYSEDYVTLTSLLRALMAQNEFSPRVLDLTESLIDLNPAHYTAWLYRAQCLFALGSDLRAELEWLNEVAAEHQKNYQVWQHRMVVVDRLGSCEGEAPFVEGMLARDAKNYHVWSYRQWLVRRFGLWEEEQGELGFTERLLGRDGRNNSAWSHRWFVLNGREGGSTGVRDVKVRDREVRFAMGMVERDPGNSCPWSYLRGIYRACGLELGGLREFVERFARVEEPEGVRSSFALELLAEIWAEEEKVESKRRAAVALDLLRDRFDPIRRNYWEYRKGMLGLEDVAV